ncbi:glycosyltransferase [Pseudodesulfovibrio cashew]|uniref:Glycosyltransferase n=1 Tax=Pseudodesulfovibrio cashew TaxID=2678688 RepID=A0A6I6JCX4_9BACT|nr:glycosyltransferase family 4 protein [Pseudodesulfovibrio cashew]QGY38999.1 glycosyltransferase [Pseudodesulfovibrio cashew]
MRIALLTSTLEGGGAARVMVNMANYWNRTGHDVVLYSFEDGSVPSYYPVDADVSIKYLSLAKLSHSLFASLKNNWERLVKIRRVVLAFAPDVLISFIDTANIRVLLAMFGSSMPVIVSERIHPKYELIGKVWSALRLLTYPTSSAIVVQTMAAGDFFPRYMRKRIAVIPNPALAPSVRGTAPRLPEKSILAVGRLYEQKDYPTLIEAFARVVQVHSEWRLCIAGQGVLLPQLKKVVCGLGLEEYVRFLGSVDDVGGLLEQADIYVLPSLYEGFPNALCEAMASGLPCISTRCPGGPDEIISHGENGLLVPVRDAMELAAAIGLLIEDRTLRNRLGASARDIVNHFSEKRIMDEWEALIKQVGRSHEN